MCNRLLKQIIRHEGSRNKMYLDSEGIETIGVGHNLRDRPISDKAIMVILEDDIDAAIMDLRNSFSWFKDLDEVRKEVLINMSFNLGITRLKEFKRTLAAIEYNNWPLAADEMLDSKWAKQVGNRAIELADQMRTGE